MQLMLTFSICGASGFRNPLDTSAGIADLGILMRIWEIGKKHFSVTAYEPGHKYCAIMIKCAPDHKVLPEVFGLLKEAGWTPYFGSAVPEELRHNHFQVELNRKYDDADYERAELLWLFGWGDDSIALFGGRRGDHWIGQAAKARWHLRYGNVDGDKNYFVNTELRDSLQRADLHGLSLGPALEWDDPTVAEGEFWELDSKVCMPRCLLPTIRLVATTWPDGVPKYHTRYNDGCYRPTEPVYLRSEVEGLGGIDVARSLEEFEYVEPNIGNHNVIVSQRFRKTLSTLGVDEVRYGIVRLVDRVEEAEFKLPDSLAYLA